MRCKLLTFVVLLLLAAVVQAEGNPSAGAGKAHDCARCHGEDGISRKEGMPNLAGQKVNYTVKQMLEMQKGKRQHYVGANLHMSRQDIEDLAAYYASLPVMRGMKNSGDLVKRGKYIYNDISRCYECHGDEGRNVDPDAPVVGGQEKMSLLKTMQAYKSGERKGGDPFGIMDTAIVKLTEQDIKALAEYLSGL
jgi:cytochrome c553